MALVDGRLDFLSFRHAGDGALEVTVLDLIRGIHIVVDGPAVHQAELAVEEVDVRRRARTESVGQFVAGIHEIRCNVAGVHSVLLHGLEAVVAFALGFVGVDQRRADAALTGEVDHRIVTAFPAFALALAADHEGTGVARENHEGAILRRCR